MNTIKGVWVFNEQPDWSYVPTEVAVNFTSNGAAYVGMTQTAHPLVYMAESGDNVAANDGGRWFDEAYRTVDFGETEQEVPVDFYDWFTANAVMQDEPETESITYSIRRETLVGIADRIREKVGTDEKYKPAKMPDGVDAVYEAGKAAGYADGESSGYDEGYAAGEEVGREHGFTEGYGAGEAIGYEDGYTKGLGDGFVEGKQAEYDAFWDVYQSKGSRANYLRAFAESYWKDSIFKPKYPITCRATQSYHTGNAQSVFQSSDVTHIDVPITIDGSAIGGVNADSFFSGADQLESVFSFTPIAVNRYTQSFLTCKKLKNITIGEGGSFDVAVSFVDSPLLTNASVQSIIDHLKDLKAAGATTQKLTLHATVGAAVTQEQKDAITAKGWTLAY